MSKIVIPLEVPATMPLPESVPTLKVTSLSIGPNVAGEFALTVTVCPGTLVLDGAPLTFSIPAFIKLLNDLAADLPVLIADLMAVFATAPSPTPPPRTEP